MSGWKGVCKSQQAVAVDEQVGGGGGGGNNGGVECTFPVAAGHANCIVQHVTNNKVTHTPCISSRSADRSCCCYELSSPAAATVAAAYVADTAVQGVCKPNANVLTVRLERYSCDAAVAGVHEHA